MDKKTAPFSNYVGYLCAWQGGKALMAHDWPSAVVSGLSAFMLFWIYEDWKCRNEP